jgi:hypothetical protein
MKRAKQLIKKKDKTMALFDMKPYDSITKRPSLDDLQAQMANLSTGYGLPSDPSNMQDDQGAVDLNKIHSSLNDLQIPDQRKKSVRNTIMKKMIKKKGMQNPQQVRDSKLSSAQPEAQQPNLSPADSSSKMPESPIAPEQSEDYSLSYYPKPQSGRELFDLDSVQAEQEVSDPPNKTMSRERPSFLQALMNADFQSNMGQAAHSFMMDGKPNDALYHNMNGQNAVYANVYNHENDRQNLIKKAILDRQTKLDLQNNKFEFNKENPLSGSNGLDLLRLQNAMRNTDLREQAIKNAQNRFDKKYDWQDEQKNQDRENWANQNWQKQTDNHINLLTSSNRAIDLLNAVRKGKIVASKNVVKALTDDVAKLLTNASSTAVSDREKAAIDSASGSLASVMSYMSSNPKNTLPPAYAQQLAKELAVLQDSVSHSFEKKYNELQSSANHPSIKNVYKNRYEIQKNNRIYALDDAYLYDGNVNNKPTQPAPDGFDYVVDNKGNVRQVPSGVADSFVKSKKGKYYVFQ